AIGITFFLIGLDQLLKPSLWASYFPQALPFSIQVAQAVLLNGLFDMFIGALLLAGLLTRIASAFATIHLVGVIFILGYNDISIRDIGLALAALSIFFHGSDNWCLDSRLRRA
ncbi:MAG: DoxX family membrane protein, partial [Nanoarchaeota archaeon]